MSNKLESLTAKVTELIKISEKLEKQNKNLVYERNKLIEKSAIVHDKVKIMVKKIQSIEARSL